MNTRPPDAEQQSQAVELFRLRYALRGALEAGVLNASGVAALKRFGELADERGDLRFEFHRWRVQLGKSQAA